jgi:hypothetical protein
VQPPPVFPSVSWLGRSRLLKGGGLGSSFFPLLHGLRSGGPQDTLFLRRAEQLGIAIEAALLLRLFRFDLKRMGFSEGIVAKETRRLPGCHFVLLF